jgi:predicted nucleotidyltransferase
MLGCKVVGVDGSDVVRVEKPGERLRELMTNHPSDKLVAASNSAIELMLQCSSLSLEDFGVFGSLLHGFHHPNFSDLDFVVYGRDRIRELCQTLQEMYADIDGVFENEFRNDDAVRDKHWRFLNLSSKEYVWHQRRKLIYALFNDTGTSRIVKTEFEPVKDWKEIVNEYNGDSRICQKGWVKMLARVTDDGEATFIPSVYGIEPLDVMEGAQSANDAVRVVSFVEEFRMQVRVDETILIEGNLEEVVTPRGSSYQVALTYCPRYYEQVLKVANFSH